MGAGQAALSCAIVDAGRSTAPLFGLGQILLFGLGQILLEFDRAECSRPEHRAALRALPRALPAVESRPA